MFVARRPAAALAWLFALAAMAWAGLADAQGAHPFGVPESGAGLGGPGWLAGVFGQVSVWQTHFYRQLTAAVRAWQADGGAWLLIGLSFAYGVFHALGPGHGKAVISSYVLANRQTARNGALLALVSSLVQALVAIAMVAVLALVFNATAAAGAGFVWAGDPAGRVAGLDQGDPAAVAAASGPCGRGGRIACRGGAGPEGGRGLARHCDPRAGADCPGRGSWRGPWSRARLSA
jgi:hypothetical protein